MYMYIYISIHLPTHTHIHTDYSYNVLNPFFFAYMCMFPGLTIWEWTSYEGVNFLRQLIVHFLVAIDLWIFIFI